MCYTARIQLPDAYTFSFEYIQTWERVSPYRELAQVNAMARPVVPVLTMESPRRFVPMRWLMVPPWIDRSEKFRDLKIWTANARIEDLEKKKLYGSLTSTNRCLVLFAGFYEWRHEENGSKTKYYLSLPQEEPMFLAGLYRTGQVDGEPYTSCSVCTMEARNVMRYIHNSALRQPVVVDYEDTEEPRSPGSVWLDPSVPLEEARQSVLDGERSAKFEPSPAVTGGQQSLF